MERITLEKARYIIVYFSHLMTEQERLALRHAQAIIKLDGSKEHVRINMYKRRGWLRSEPEILTLLNDGEDQFIQNCAERILTETPEQVFFNNCTKCGHLARTPLAKQCRFCGFDWH